jgi:ATP-dependent helicase/nuclease subunit B
MYDWLADALRGSSQVVTANRRLARVLATEFGKQQVANGCSAWRSPAVRSWQDWLAELLASAELSAPLPTRINAHQSRVLWERCLRREIADPLLNIAMLVRQARESWGRLHEFQVPLAEWEMAAQGKDQKIFANASKSYQSILDREFWVDDAGLAGLVTKLINDRQMHLPKAVTFAGFDRLVPQVMTLIESISGAGVCAAEAPGSLRAQEVVIYSYENPDAELRAAGAWVRGELQNSPDQDIAIVATHLEQDAERYTRLIREGVAPGWQTSGSLHKAAVNVSYGRNLSAYPAIAVAMLALRWLQSDLGSSDISTLLRSSVTGRCDTGGRSRLELSLRQLPDRNWSPAMILSEFEGREDTLDVRDWLVRVGVLDALRSELPRRESPSKWVLLIDEILKKINWPGDGSLNSVEFQLVNKWRELLNDLARLELVSSTMTFAEALGRLTTMANETIFQAESEGSIVHLLGPLEAAGMHFDKLWITGLSASNWPPPGRPSSLVSRKIQRLYGMPDAEPDDTLDYAHRVLERLVSCASHVSCSYPLTAGDAEQSATALLANIAEVGGAAPNDPGWYATRLVASGNPAAVAIDPVPEVSVDESISGGATTINRQIADPFSAFAFGRLGIRSMPGITGGLAASLRGTLVHDALRNLYSDLPSRKDVDSWSESVLQKRIDSALKRAFWRHERHADPVLQQLYRLERRRVAHLLHGVISLDRKRDDFVVAEVEGSLEIEISGLRLRLRVDRIDRLADGDLVILDYKTGTRRPFLDRDGEPRDVQLVVYALGVRGAVAGLGLFNIDSRSIDIDGAGRSFTPDLDWDGILEQWKNDVVVAADALQRGDVRLNAQQNSQSARPLSLLSRIVELRRDA